jgi:hypothetical protein
MRQGIKTILIALTGLLAAINAAAQWTPVSVPTKNNLNSISIIEGTSGWIVGDKGTMLYLDYGSWLSYPAVTDQNLYSVFLLNSSEGWAVGSKGTILHLEDKKWVNVSSPTHQDLNSVCFSSADNGFAVGNNGTFLYYRNGIWEMAERMTPGHFYTVTINNNQAYFAGGRENITIPLMKADFNSNYRFTKLHNPGYYEITGLSMPEANLVWAVGKPGIILHNDGAGWEKVETEEKLPSLTGVYFTSKDIGIAVGYGGTIMTYTPGGWVKENPDVSVKLNGTIISGSTYYAVGNSGTLLQLKLSVPVPDDKESQYPLKISSYPNPSSDNLNITIPDKAAGNSVVTVMNSGGKVVLMKDIGSGSQGRIDQISTAGLSDGLYIVNIISGGQVIGSGKFIVKH